MHRTWASTLAFSLGTPLPRHASAHAPQHATSNPMRQARPCISRRVLVRSPITAVLQEEAPPPVKTIASPAEPAQRTVSGLALLPEPAQNACLLALVPFLWGSYGVAAKLLLDSSYPMPLALLNLSSFTFAYLAMVGARRLYSKEEKHAPEAIAATRAAGAELGIYLYIGSWLNLEALARTSASRAAFFVQLTTILVPLADWVLGARLSRQVFAACAMALSGAAVLAQSADASAEALSPAVLGALNVGDLVAIASAMFYSVHVTRLERLSKKSVGPLTLVEGKALMQTILSLLAVIALMQQGHPEIASYANNFFSMPASGVLSSVWWTFWIGAGTTALATWAQVVGQERVGPSRSAVFYASQPVWAAGLACAVGMDRLTPHEVLGGSLIVGAGALLALADRNENRRKNDESST